MNKPTLIELKNDTSIAPTEARSHIVLALNDQQIATVMRAASLLPVHDRDRFLRSVANRLDLNGGSPSERDLAVAISLVLEGRGIAAKPHVFCNKVKG